MNIKIMKITPKDAKNLLSKNNSNRKINKSHLDMLIRTIKKGEWRLNHQGIAVYEDGDIADGQHRLTAIVETGVALEMPVFTGIKKDVYTSLSIDCGRSRTVTDGAKICGDNLNSKDVVLVKGLEYGYESAFPKLSHSDSYRLCQKRTKQIELANNLFIKHKAMITIAPVKVACIVAIELGVDFNTVKSFIDTLVTGEYTNQLMTNAVKVRNKLLSQNFNGGSHRALAYNMVLNALKRTDKRELIARVNTNKTPSKV